MSAQGLVAFLGWGTDDFEKAVPGESTESLWEAKRIFQAPDPPGTEEWYKQKVRYAIRRINEELELRDVPLDKPMPPTAASDAAMDAFERMMGVDWGTTDECAVVFAKISTASDGKHSVQILDSVSTKDARKLRRGFWGVVRSIARRFKIKLSKHEGP
jgi:hypothetical protein